MTFQNRAHPWHGVSLSDDNLETVTCYIEIITGDTIKFEVDKASGLLKVDRPQKYSNASPCLYGMLPQTYSGKRVAAFCGEKLQRSNLIGDGDPIDICILTDNSINQNDILLSARILGGFRMIDNDETDDKLIAVLKGDPHYDHIKDMKDLPEAVLTRIEHYFLSYKESPEDLQNYSKRKIELAGRYGHEEALEIVRLSQKDYLDEIKGSL